MSAGQSLHDPNGKPRRVIVGTIGNRSVIRHEIGRTYRKPRCTAYRLHGCIALLACIASNDPQGVSYALHARHGSKPRPKNFDTKREPFRLSDREAATLFAIACLP